MAGSFQFKQFLLSQIGAAHKAGTDSVLLGAWIQEQDIKSVLDIGAGTGILALMMAQKFTSAHIDAIEIDPNAAACARANFKASKFNKRINITEGDYRKFEPRDSYNLVISNPPYFTEGPKSAVPEQALARHNQHLSFAELLNKTFKCLQHQGTFCLILPYAESERFLNLAKATGFSNHRRCLVYPKPGKAPNRILIALKKSDHATEQTEEITVRNAIGEYSDAYKHLTKAFYLKL